MWFKAYHEHGHGGTVDASNYTANINPETCIGCGLCVKRCPMEAIQLEASDEAQNKVGKVAVLEQEKCIGCGVCAYKCPSKSILLESREETTEPPTDMNEFFTRFLTDLSDPLPRRKTDA